MKPVQFGIVLCLATGVALPAAAQELKAITGATVITMAGARIPDAAVIIDGGRIVGVGPAAKTPVPPGATVVDATGKFIVPGLADMHNHVLNGGMRPVQNLKTNLSVLFAFGVTTVFNPSVSLKDFADLKAASTDTAALPRFFGTGPSVTVKGDGLGAAGSLTPETAEDAHAAVRTLKSAGVDAIKTARDDASWATSLRIPVMNAAVLEALVREAHQEGLKVFVHAPLLDHAREALRAGVDGLLHGIIDRPVDQAFVDLMIRNRAVYVPTLAMFEDVGDVAAFGKRQAQYDARGVLSLLGESFAAPDFVQRFTAGFNATSFTKERLPVLRANLKRVFDAGIPVVMGTDSGFFGVLMGVSSQLELALMVEAGLTPDAALRAATINAARMLGREKDAGSIEPGKLADLLILDADPLQDIGNVRRIHRVIKGGVVHEPAQVIGDFKIVGPRQPPPGR